jgi:hypothetical protein
MTGHNADPDAVRVRSLAMALGDEILARYVAELDQAAERLAARYVAGFQGIVTDDRRLDADRMTTLVRRAALRPGRPEA